MSDMLLDPVREACTFTLGCADGCPCWAPADYEVFERGVGPSPACTDHANQIREEAEERGLRGVVVRTVAAGKAN